MWSFKVLTTPLSENASITMTETRFYEPARLTEHPTQTLVFTKTAERQPGLGHCYLRSFASSATMVLAQEAMFMLNLSL